MHGRLKVVRATMPISASEDGSLSWRGAKSRARGPRLDLSEVAWQGVRITSYFLHPYGLRRCVVILFVVG